MTQFKRFFRPAAKSYFLFGPRGTGKSSYIKSHYPDAHVIDLLEPDILRIYQAYPERLKETVHTHSHIKTFVIDEVQKVPALLSAVHQLIEEDKQRQFILAGSSVRKLKRQGVDLLAGRAQLKHLHPFMAAEMGEYFNLEKSLKFGMVPLVVDSSDPVGDLKTYIALYVKEEVMIEGVIRKVEQFNQFLEVISFSQGNILNCSNIARECHISSKTVSNYVQILEDLLLSFTLPIFTRKAKRSLTSHPKFYFFDAGVFQSVRPSGPLDNPGVVVGAVLETLVAQHLRAWLDYSDAEGKLYFWRTRGGMEVDFIIYGEIGFYAIEVKSSKTVRKSDLRGLEEFQKDYPQASCLLLYGGKEKRRIGNSLCLPVQDFLMGLWPNQALGTD